EINFIPSIVVADNVAGGGNPNARPPAPVVQPVVTPPPAPAPQPKPAEPPPEKKAPEPEKPQAPDPDSFAESKKPRKPQIVTTPMTRTKPKTADKPTPPDTSAQDRQALEARRRAAQEFAKAASEIGGSTVSVVAVPDGDFGPGGGGSAYAGYDVYVQMIYQHAWVKPSDVSTDSPVTYATVTIARDGSVVPGSARVITRSGDSQMDSSVQRTLERVTSVGKPFPDDMNEKQRTYKIKFDLQKSGLA